MDTITPGFWESLVQSCSAAIVGATLDGTIVSWNAGAERLYGYTAAEAVGKPLGLLYSPHRPEGLAEQLELVRAGKRPCHHETVHRLKHGDHAEVLLTISPITNLIGMIVGVSLVGQDIMQGKQQEKERLDLIRELTHALTQTTRERLENSPTI